MPLNIPTPTALQPILCFGYQATCNASVVGTMRASTLDDPPRDGVMLAAIALCAAALAGIVSAKDLQVIQLPGYRLGLDWDTFTLVAGRASVSAVREEDGKPSETFTIEVAECAKGGGVLAYKMTPKWPETNFFWTTTGGDKADVVARLLCQRRSDEANTHGHGKARSH